MSDTSTPAAPVTLTRPGTEPATRHKLFLSLPVADLQQSVRFFEALGFAFNPHFTSAQETCMLIGEDAYAMLLTHERIADFTTLPLADPRVTTCVGLAFSVDSRAAVDAMIEAALAAGGTISGEPQDHGFMFSRSFADLDGHVWDAFWMDPVAADPSAHPDSTSPAI
ncbi:MAG TPA: VOC family protein [Rubricoccaceae bacterium]